MLKANDLNKSQSFKILHRHDQTGEFQIRGHTEHSKRFLTRSKASMFSS